MHNLIAEIEGMIGFSEHVMKNSDKDGIAYKIAESRKQRLEQVKYLAIVEQERIIEELEVESHRVNLIRLDKREDIIRASRLQGIEEGLVYAIAVTRGLTSDEK